MYFSGEGTFIYTNSSASFEMLGFSRGETLEKSKTGVFLLCLPDSAFVSNVNGNLNSLNDSLFNFVYITVRFGHFYV